MLVAGLAAPARATPPSLDFVRQRNGYIEASYVVYQFDLPYVIELGISNIPGAYGAFAAPLAHINVQVPPGLNRIYWKSDRRFPPGVYFLHAALDRTAETISGLLRCVS